MNYQFRCKKLLLQGLCLIIFDLFSCGGGVDEETMYALNNLKAEVESLRAQVKAKEDEKESIQKQISDKDAKIRHCSETYQKTILALEGFNISEEDIPILIQSNVKAAYYVINKKRWNEIPEFTNNFESINIDFLRKKGINIRGYTDSKIFVNETTYVILFEYSGKYKTIELKPSRTGNYKDNPQVLFVNF